MTPIFFVYLCIKYIKDVICKIIDIIFCLIEIHDYEYKTRKINGVDSFGRKHTTNAGCRECRSCGKLQMWYWWGYETIII